MSTHEINRLHLRSKKSFEFLDEGLKLTPKLSKFYSKNDTDKINTNRVGCQKFNFYFP